MKLFQTPDQEFLVGEDAAGSLVQWPAKLRGYDKRTAYRGLRRDLIEADPRLSARTGWPGCPRGPIPHRGESAARVIHVRVTEAERAAWAAAAAAGKRKVSDWARRLLNGALDATARIAALEQRQQELLATIVRLTNEVPFPDEVKDWAAQRAALVAEVGSLRARVAELERCNGGSP